MAASNHTLEACKVIASTSSANVSYKGSEQFKAAQDSYFSAQEEQLVPACIVKPTTTEQVSAAVKALVEKKVPFAVRGGGHTLNAGAANIDSGVTLNLRALNTVTVDTEKQIVSIGGGAKWGEVYSQTDAHGLATSGGRVADVGVGGLTTGGGISFFSAREGLACDNVVNYEVVLASGEVINANANEHSDLWVALKGGSGSNFGVVTRFDIPTFPQSKFYGGVIVWPIETVDAQLKAYADMLENFDPYDALIMSISYGQATGARTIFSNIEYTKGGDNPEGMQAFTSIQPQYMNTMRVSTMSDFTVEAGAFSASGRRNQFATTTCGGGLEAVQEVYSLWNTSVDSIASVQGITWALTIQPFPPAFSAKTKEKGGNSLGLDPSEGPLTLVLLSYNWDNTSDDDFVLAKAKELMTTIDEAMKARGAYNEFKYLNYAADWQNPLRGYGEVNVARLKEVSQKYDPEGAFQTYCPGGFKVSKA